MLNQGVPKHHGKGAPFFTVYRVSRGPCPGPTFRFRDGKPLTRVRFVAEVKKALDQSGVDSSCYSGHSFRSGAATTAVKRGLGDATIQMLGRPTSRTSKRQESS